jgi:putative hydrolase of the HAD superfamily
MIDVDGVIVNGRPADGRHWATELEADLGVSPVDLDVAFFKPWWERIVTGRASLREPLTNVLGQMAPNVTPDQLLSYWFEHDARLNQQFLRDLATIRANGLPAFLATNQEHDRVRYLMETLGLSAHVDGCHYSAEIGHRKPRSEFFQIVALRIGLPPDNLLLIDDSEDNVRAARAVGWHAARWTADRALTEIVATAFPENGP